MSTPPITNPAGRELVERDSFENEAIWLPAMAVQHLNDQKFVIEDKTFTGCLIEGPAVLGIGEGVTFDGCNMGSARDVRSLLLTPRGSHAAGVVGFKNCRFVGCHFNQIGFTGSVQAVDEMERGLSSAREAMEKAMAEQQAKDGQA